MITANDILTDAQVAKLAGIALCTFQRRMTTGFLPGELDWNAARPMTFGRRRFWLRADVEKVIKERITK